jgi:hypothetical protein
MTVGGDPLEVDADQPLTRIALQAGQDIGALNELTTVMNGGDASFSQGMYVFSKAGLDNTAYTVGHRIMNALRDGQQTGMGK